MWGVIYGMLVLAKGAFPAWGWPEQTEANPALAWLSLLVAYSIMIGFGYLHLLFIGRRLSFSPFWIDSGQRGWCWSPAPSFACIRWTTRI